METIIVLALISLMAGILSVNFANTLPSAKLQAAAREMAAALRSARISASVNQAPAALVVDLGAKQYFLRPDRIKSLPAGIGMKIVDGALEEKLDGRYEFVFQPAGAAEPGSIVLWNERKSVRVQLDPVAGAVIVR